MSGDFLAIFLFFAGSAVAALLAALTSAPGWPRAVLRVVFSIFLGACLGWAWWPRPLPVQLIWQVLVALTPLLTVLMVVLWTTGRKAPPN